MKIYKHLIVALAVCFAGDAAAQEVPFFDTSKPDRILTFGIRVGLNSSGVSTNYMSIQPELIQSNFYWRSGGQAGGVVDLHIRNFFAIQVGCFWENRSYDCTLMAAAAEEDYMGSLYTHARFNYVNLPVLLSFRFNLLPQAVWQVDAGCYYAYGISGKKEMDSYIAFGESEGQLVFDHALSSPSYFGADPKEFLAVNRADFGLKLGTGLTFFDRYVVGVYYQRSIKNVAKNYEGGPDYHLRNCSWSVNIGYNF